MLERFYHLEEKLRRSPLWRAVLDPVRLLCAGTLLALAVGVALVAYSAAVSSGENLAAALAALRAEKLSALFFALAMAGSLGYYITDAALLGGLWSRAAFVQRIGRMDALLWGCLLGSVLGLFLL